MLKLSFMLLQKRKKFVAVIIGIISLSAMLAIFANMTANSIYEQKKELALKTYGSFICGANELTPEDIEKINDNENIKAGFFELFQNTNLEDSVLTIGYGDANFIDMSNAVLEAGVMPMRGDEVAVERFVAEMYGISEPGENIELSIGGTKKSVRVTGIVRNYSNQLSVHYRIEKGVNNYPNIFCCKEGDFYLGEGQTARSALFGFVSPDGIGADQISTINKMQENIGRMGLSVSIIYDNDNLFNRGLLYCNNMKMLCNVFSGIMIIATVFCSWSLLRIFYREYGKKLAVFMSYGLRKRQCLYIVGIQLLFFMALSSCISISGGLIINHYLGGILFPTIRSSFTLSNFKFLCIWFGIFYLLLAFLFYRIFHSIYQTSIYQTLAKGIFYVRKQAAKKPLHFNLVKSIRYPQWGITSLFVFLFFICFFVLNSYSVTQSNYDGFPDYELFSKEITETESMDGYEIEYNPDSYISADALEELGEFGDDVYIDSFANVNSNTLLLRRDQVSSYFERWSSNYAPEPTQYKESIIRSKWPDEASKMFPVPNVAFIVADEQQFQKIREEYNLDVKPESLLNEPGILLFLPESHSGEDVGINVGDKLVLGGINLRGQEVSFYTVDVNLEGIVRSPYELSTNAFKQERTEMTIVVSSKFAGQEEFFRGYKELRVYVDNDLSEERLNEIDNCINKIQSGIQGGVLYSKKATQEAEIIYASYIHALGISMMVIILIFSGIFVYAQIYNSLKEKAKEYGVLRVLGMSVDMLSQNIFISYISSMLLSFGVDLLVVIILFSSSSLLSYSIKYIIVSCFIVFLLTLVSKFLPQRILRKTVVRHMINS